VSNLEELRQHLLNKNHDFFRFLDERKALVASIVDLKNNRNLTTGHWKNFDLQREKNLFRELKGKLLCVSPRELLAFSLIIESHAKADRSLYPSWSSMEHLEEDSRHGTIWEMINPVMLHELYPAEFRKLSLISHLRKEFTK